MSAKGGGKAFTGSAGNGPLPNIKKTNGPTPQPAGKPKGGLGLARNPNLKGGSGSY